jgi:hypothetical protein
MKDFPYVVFDDDTDRGERSYTLRQAAAKLIERNRAGQRFVGRKLSGAVAWLLYRVADLMDWARF